MVINDIEINGLREICGVRRIERLIEEKLFSYSSKKSRKVKRGMRSEDRESSDE